MYTKSGTNNENPELPMDSEPLELEDISIDDITNYKTINISECNDFPQASNLAVYNDICGNNLTKKNKNNIELSYFNQESVFYDQQEVVGIDQNFKES